MPLINKVCVLYMNRNESYDEDYYFNNHLKKLNSFYGFFTRRYYRYLAKSMMAKAAEIKKNDKVLDVGCGVGILVKEFSKLGYRATGIDVNNQAIKHSISPENCFLTETSNKLEYKDDHFDLVVSREVLEHIPPDEIDACIAEWDRISKGNKKTKKILFFTLWQPGLFNVL